MIEHRRRTRVTKEPTYESTPKYGVIRVGNGPKSEISIALDEPSDETAETPPIVSTGPSWDFSNPEMDQVIVELKG